MKARISLLALTLAITFLTGCMTQEARTERVRRRQDGIDARSAARAERWEIRAQREDARCERRFDSW